MLPLPRGAVWQTLFLLCAVLFVNEVRSEGRVVCYYTNWSVYRPGTAKFNPQNINPYLCTHLVYAFGGFTKDNQMKPFDKYQDIEQGGYAKFTGLKTYNKQLKTMIAIGGWNEASTRFSPLMASPERRQQFIKNILKFLRQNHFDGIDLDWEYPAHREGGKPRDRDNYAQFVQELRAEFERESQKTGRPRLLLTMAVPAGIEYIEKGYDIPKLNKYLDWFNVLSYDFHSSHEPSANHHAPLYSLEEESEYNYDAELNIDYAIKYYLKAGADRDKLVLGIPTYGRSYTLINEESTDIGAPAEAPGEQGDATREKGYLAYYEICQNIKDDPEWTVVQPNPNAMGPYAYRRNQWVGYDDEAIVRKKAQYVVEHGLGGIMFWAIDNDDFRGLCTGKPYPLIEAAKEAMLDGLGLGINEVSKPSAAKKPLRSRSRENSSSNLNRIAGEKSSAARTSTSSGRRRTQVTSTAAPETTIRLTAAEGSSLYIGGRTTTPAPPTTPDPGTDFKCEEEGFFQHPRDCKKYYWCLDSGPSGLGIVGHQFTCPSGLYFNPAADSCDFARNVPCKTKKSTTAAPVTTTSTTTARPTSAPNRITAATSRTSFFRTTTTTTTTSAPVEEYEDEEEEVQSHLKEKDAEEDPQVIKELIELIRKVGGIEELEKHLLRKEDGTISIKETESSNGAATTPSPISKKLYDKVLSKPKAFNSLRNRFTSTTLYRNSGQTKSEEAISEVSKSEETAEQEKERNSSGYSKYSSVVRGGNSRQGPQNEGLDKIADFDGFLKEKKQYVTINRNRGVTRVQESGGSELEETEEEEELEETTRTTKRPVSTVTPSYASIRRTRPTTVKSEAEEEEELKVVKETEEKRTYTSLNRNRGRQTTTTESAPTAEDVVSTTNRYKYLERTRPTRRSFGTSAAAAENGTDDDEEEEDQDDDEEQKNLRTSTVATNSRRPVLSVRRRLINSPTATSGTPVQTATMTTTATATATATITTTANTKTPTTAINGELITTTDTTTTSKSNRNRNNNNRAATGIPITTTAITTTTSSSSASSTNKKNYLSNKYNKTKLTASTDEHNLASATTTAAPPTSSPAATSTSANDIIQRANTKFPATVLRRKFQTRRLPSTTTVNPTDESATDVPRTQNPLFKRRFSQTAAPFITTTTTTANAIPYDAPTTTLYVDGLDSEDASDQVAKSSIHTSRFNKINAHVDEEDELEAGAEFVNAIKALAKAPAAATTTPATLNEDKHNYVESITRRIGTVAATTTTTATTRKIAIKRRPQKTTPSTSAPVEARSNNNNKNDSSVRKRVVSRRRPNKYGDTVERLNGNQATPVKAISQAPGRTYRPTVDYDYYDDGDERLVGNTKGQQLKVILHGRGIIECLDQGNFPHPLSCRKFISCAKFETGGVVGWEYTCPKGLSYDPVGGMCNWAAGLGCKE